MHNPGHWSWLQALFKCWVCVLFLLKSLRNIHTHNRRSFSANIFMVYALCPLVDLLWGRMALVWWNRINIKMHIIIISQPGQSIAMSICFLLLDVLSHGSGFLAVLFTRHRKAAPNDNGFQKPQHYRIPGWRREEKWTCAPYLINYNCSTVL